MTQIPFSSRWLVVGDAKKWNPKIPPSYFTNQPANMDGGAKVVELLIQKIHRNCEQFHRRAVNR
jgi:hypothetical protein